MQPGEPVANLPQVTVEDQPIPTDVEDRMVQVCVEDGTDLPGMFVLRFTDDHGTLLQDGKFSLGTKIEVGMQTAGAERVTLLTGEVTAIETEVAHDGLHIVVRGFDKVHRLSRGRRTATYSQSTSGDIVRQVVQAAGLPVGQIDTTRHIHEHVTQEAVSDWDFLCRLAERENCRITMRDGKISFRRPPVTAATGGDAGSGQGAVVIKRDERLIALRATVTAAGQTPEVRVRGWDPATKRATVGIMKTKAAGARLSATNPEQLASRFQSPPHIMSRPGLRAKAECDAVAQSMSDRLAGGFAELEGTVLGNPNLRAGTTVSLDGIGEPFDQGYYALTSTRHEFTPDDGYQTTFTASNRSQRSLYGVASAGGGRSDAGPRLLPALVTNTKDPDGLGRVKVQFPTLSDEVESGWARLVYPGAGADRGLVCIPEVHDEVLVATGDGFDDVYVIGGLFNGKDKPPAPKHEPGRDGKTNRRWWTSRTGMTVQFLEEALKEKVEISTNDGQQRVTLLQSEKGIEIMSEGPVQVTAKQDVSVETQTGNVTLKGSNVTIEATNALQLKGSTVKTQGTGSAELSASGVTTVRGSMVKIN